MPTLTERKRAELDLKLRGLADEFDTWRSRTKDGKWEKHFTQVGRLTHQLGRAQATLVKRANDPTLDVADAMRALEMEVLALHRIWDFFRSKLSQRENDELRRFLIAADDLAWACYDPVRKAMIAAFPDWRQRVKEPPLCFLNGGSSPFVQVRNRQYQVEDTLDDGLDPDGVGRLVQKLPIPVIGIPWYELSHLPEVLVVAHEVGHAVEFDLGLTDELHAALGAAPLGEHLPAWEAWCSEAFADVFGAVACGPAFVGTMFDFLTEPVASIATESRAKPLWGEYPTTALRWRLVLAAIREAGHGTEADEREQEMFAVYGEKHAMQDYDADVPHVVRAFATTKFKHLDGKDLLSLVGFGKTAHDRARHAADDLLDRASPTTNDVREILAGVRLAFERRPEALAPVARGGLGASLRALTKLETERLQGPRGTPHEDEQTDVDTEAGDQWLAALDSTPRVTVRA